MKLTILTSDNMQAFGQALGKVLKGGEVIELVGDVGSGKTTLVKGVGLGLTIDEDVQSPTFTISRSYPARDGLQLDHYDFYRLSEPGVMSYELAESVGEPKTITIIEWAETVTDVLPDSRTTINLRYRPSDEGRELELTTALPYIEETYVSWSQN